MTLTKTTTTHTPGPWEFFIGTDLRYRVTPQRPQKPAVICEMIRIESDSEYPNDAVLANARLISAAPDMLAALQALVAYADAYSDKMREIGRGAEQLGAGADSMSVSAAARAAITKATGA